MIDHGVPGHDPLHGFHHDPADLILDGKTRRIDVYVQGEQGPPLILLHELPGLSEQTFQLGNYFVGQGFRVVMPLLFGHAGQDNMAAALVQICVRRELLQLWLGAESGVVRLIHQLAAREWQHDQCSGNGAAGVAVVGMCFIGSMVLALLLDQPSSAVPIAAPVMAQPSAGFSATALDAVRLGRLDRPILTLRFEKDWICSPAHFRKLEQAFAACPAQSPALIVHELEGRGHSTLVYDYDPDQRRRDLRSPANAPIDARQAVSCFIRNQMGLPPRFGTD